MKFFENLHKKYLEMKHEERKQNVINSTLSRNRLTNAINNYNITVKDLQGRANNIQNNDKNLKRKYLQKET